MYGVNSVFFFFIFCEGKEFLQSCFVFCIFGQKTFYFTEVMKKSWARSSVTIQKSLCLCKKIDAKALLVDKGENSLLLSFFNIIIIKDTPVKLFR